VTVELAQQRDEENRPTYKYRVTDEAAGIDHEDTDLYLSAFQVPSNTMAARTVLAELEAAAEAFLAGHAIEADAFPSEVVEWAIEYGDEIGLAQIELGGGLKR
jgi:hypothetical protein